MIDTMIKNMTELSNQIDESKLKLEGVEAQCDSVASENFQKNDGNMNLDTEQKAIMFDNVMMEYEQSINLMTKKFGVLDKKLEAMGDLTEDFHSSTDKLELLFKKDIG